MKFFFSIVAITLVLSSCSDEVPLVSNNSSDAGENVEIEVKDGYLIFSSDSVFKRTIEAIQSQEDDPSETRASSCLNNELPNVEGFKSIASLQKELARQSTRSSGSEYESDADDEEMSLDEYNAMKAEDLLIDPSLTEVMDTTLRIQISDRLYKVTKYGTFSVDTNNEASLYDEIAKFDTTLVRNVENGQTIMLNNGVSFTNTYGNRSIESENLQIDPQEVSTRAIESTNGINLQQGYNTLDFKWKNHSVWQKFWDTVSGKDVYRENSFDKKHRVQVEVFNVNYQFYASAGLKVKMQKRKKFLFAKYWVSDTAEKIAVGFNCVTGKLTFNNPASYSSFAPSPNGAWKSFKSTLNDQIHDFVYTEVNASRIPILKSWCNASDKIYLCLPKINIATSIGDHVYKLEYPTKDVLQSMYNLPAKLACVPLNSLTGKVFASIEKKITPKDPRIAYYIWGNSEYTFDKARPYIMGVKEYGSQKSKTVRFSQSFGLNYTSGLITPFLPDKFSIKNIDCFGAVKYNGNWKGVRFVGDKHVW